VAGFFETVAWVARLLPSGRRHGFVRVHAGSFTFLVQNISWTRFRQALAPAIHEPFNATTLSVADGFSSPDEPRVYRDVLRFTVVRMFERGGHSCGVAQSQRRPILLTQDDGAKGQDRLKGRNLAAAHHGSEHRRWRSG
jgi:hypothetical protein